jgi:hypothetical protein
LTNLDGTRHVDPGVAGPLKFGHNVVDGDHLTR